MVCWSCSLKEGWLISRSRFKPEPAGLIFRQSNVFLYMNPCSSPPKWKGYWHILWGLTSALLSGGDWMPMGSPRAFTGGWPASQPAPSKDWVPLPCLAMYSKQPSLEPSHRAARHSSHWQAVEKGGGTGLTATHSLLNLMAFNSVVD